MSATALAFLDTAGAGQARARRLGTWRIVRRIRLATGSCLWVYVATHLCNHALGLVSVPAMESGLLVQKWIWQGVLGTAALYVSLATHLLLGLWALYEKRHFRPGAMDAAQLGLGLLIPVLLANHLFVTRVAYQVFDLDKGYAQELHALWVASATWGAVQVAVLLAAWTHGCIGLYASIRLRSWFPRASPVLLTAAVLLPVLALLGFEEGGRTIARAVHDPAWATAELAAPHTGTDAQKHALGEWRILFWECYGGALGLVLLIRLLRSLRERTRATVAITYPNGAAVRVPRGLSVLDASRIARIPHASVCGGRGRCTTCRVRVIGPAASIPAPDEGERAVLARVRSDPEAVRLACQLRPAGPVGVIPLVPPPLAREFAAFWGGSAIGEERFVVALFADMRGSTRFAQKHLPYDGVFLLGRFVSALAESVARAGGVANQFTGDGILALFGLHADTLEARNAACRAAVQACRNIADAVESFNDAFASSLAGRVDYGIGLHAGRAIVGEIGLGRNVTVTALGDPVNIASRLQAATRETGCHALISREVLLAAGAESAEARPVAVRDGGEVDAVAFSHGALRAKIACASTSAGTIERWRV